MNDDFSFGGGLDGTGGLYDPADVPQQRGSDPSGAGGLYDVPMPSAPVSDRQPETTMKPTQPQGGFFGAITDIIGGVTGDKPGGGFGSGMVLPGLLGRPSYQPTNPNAAPADMAADMLQQRMQRASSVATNPFVQLFNPQEAKRAQEFLQAAPKALQEAKTQQATVAANMNQAKILGLDPGEGGTNEYSTEDQRVQVAQQRAMKGDLNAFRGLQTVKPKAAEEIQDKVYEAVSGHIGKATEAFGTLSNMTTPREYDEAVKMLRGNGTLSDLESMGLKVPTFDQFQAQKAGMGRTLRETQQGLNQIGTKLKERNSFVPMEKNEAETYKGTFKTAYGDTIEAGPMTRNQTSGVRGMVVQGMANPDGLGKTFVLASPDQRKALREEFETALPKNQYEKLRESQRLYGMATTDGKGGYIGDGKINTNPNIQQGIAEGLAAALRGGNGGANGQLLNIEAGKRGWTQTMLDKMKGGWSGLANVIDGPDGKKEYLTDATQKQMRDVLDYLHNYDKQHIAEAVGGVVERAGALGLDPSVFGLSKKEAGVVADLLETGRQNQVGRMLPYHRAVGSGNGVLMVDPETSASPSPVGAPAPVGPGGGARGALPSRERQDFAVLPAPGASPAGPGGGGPQPTPPGSDPRYGDASRPIPGEKNIPPVGPAGGPQGPSGSGGGGGLPGGGGGPQPNLPVPTTGAFARAQAPAPAGRPGAPQAPGSAVANVAGQNVSVRVPAGASTGYVSRMQTIESGAERDPWRATTKKSSASGAFQFIDSTWAANKPAGAPARAKDATPAQQVQALENFTAKNAAALGARGLPVNDATLYIAHNLGVGGAQKLLKADPGASASAVVGADAARNNPKFFSGGATVGEAVQRYQMSMGAGGGGVAMPATAGIPVQPGGAESGHGVAPIPGWAANRRAQALENNQNAASKETVAGMAPAALGTAGALAGTAVGGPVGGVAGGAAGGALGASIKNWVQGKPQDPKEIAKEAALSGALGVVSAARPVVTAAARVAGVAGIEGGEAAIEGKRPSEIAEAAGKGAAVALGGEAFGRGLGMLGHKLFNTYSPAARAELQTMGNQLNEARAVVSKTEPKLATGGANPAYQAADEAAKKAETRIKEMGQDPDAVAYSAQAHAEGVPGAEARATKPLAAERARAGEGYEQIKGETAEAGRGSGPSKIPRLPDGPLAKAEASGMSGQVLKEAERAEMVATSKADNWGEKWNQLADARKRLLKQERSAETSTSQGRSGAADDYRVLADSIRKQQEKVAGVVFGPVEGAKMINRLKALDVRYAKVMKFADAEGNLDVASMAALSGAKGREADRAFKALASGDQDAIRAWDSLRRQARNEAGGFHGAMHAIGRLPVVGHAASLVHVGFNLRKFVEDMAVGKPVRFKDMVQANAPAAANDVGGQIGAAAARGMAM